MDPKQRNVLSLVVVGILVIGSWALFWPPGKRITQGLDIRGGLSVILTAQQKPGQTLKTSDLERAELIVRNRVDRLGASESSIQRQGNDSILIQLPGVKNPEQALELLGETGQLEFVEVASIQDSSTLAAIASGDKNIKVKEGTYEPFMTGEVVKTAAVSQDPNTGQIEVNVTMDSKGTQTWAEVTTRLFPTRGQVAIILDGVVKSAPAVQDAITDGQTRITGDFTVDEAKALKTVLETGALPVDLEPSESRVVGPTLGQDSLRQGVMAILIGVGLVALYLIVLYRGLGLTSVAALFVFASLFLGSLALLSQFNVFSLTLPGIAGIVLTIGIAADSSILILERFKEEVRMGKTFRSAAAGGTRHAIGTSVDADLVTFVSALFLFLFAIGPVRGFALTLMIGIALDILVMVLFKRPIIIMLAESAIPKAPAFWAMPKEVVAIKGKTAAKGGAANV